MLRISTIHVDEETRFKLEGKLAHEWVAEAARAWNALHDAATSRAAIIVDLCAVSFVDDGGRALLTQMHSSGAKLVGAGPLIGNLIQEISDCSEHPLKTGKWVRGIVSVILFL